MPIELKIPAVGESITDVRIGNWLKKIGDRVNRDEPVVTVETDKVTIELPAPAPGVLQRILLEQGQDARVGDVVGYLEEQTDESEPAVPEPAASKPAASKPAVPEPAASEPAVPDAARKSSERSQPPTEGGANGRSSAVPDDRRESERPAPQSASEPDTLPPAGYARVMPSARRALRERGISPDEVTPTGPGGRILKEDVLRHDMQPQGGSPRIAEPVFEAHGRLTIPENRHEDFVPMSPLRRRIAERLVEAQRNAALLTTFNEVDMSSVNALRKEYRDAFLEKHGIKLGLMSFFVKAVVEALKLVPAVNAEVRGTTIVYKNYYDIGVAIGGGRGLVVPVIRSAERLGFAEIEKSIADFAQRAQVNQLKLEELQGGTFTISNGGIYGSMLSTPIINPPQSGILGMHAIEERAVVRGGQIVVRPMMYIALSYDHRVVDGREAVTFLKQVKSSVENPARILLEV